MREWCARVRESARVRECVSERVSVWVCVVCVRETVYECVSERVYESVCVVCVRACVRVRACAGV